MDVRVDLTPANGIGHRVPAGVLGPNDELVDVGEVVQAGAGGALALEHALLGELVGEVLILLVHRGAARPLRPIHRRPRPLRTLVHACLAAKRDSHPRCGTCRWSVEKVAPSNETKRLSP